MIRGGHPRQGLLAELLPMPFFGRSTALAYSETEVTACDCRFAPKMKRVLLRLRTPVTFNGLGSTVHGETLREVLPLRQNSQAGPREHVVTHARGHMNSHATTSINGRGSYKRPRDLDFTRDADDNNATQAKDAYR